MDKEEEKEFRRRLYQSERNAEGNFTADELYKRLLFHSPWIEEPEWSSKTTRIYEVLEFLEQYPTGDIRIIFPTMPPIMVGVEFDRPLKQIEIKDMQVELNADVHPDRVRIMFNLDGEPFMFP
jgi:hypothetical protein